MLSAPKLAPFCQLKVDLAKPQELGKGRAGHRRIIPIIGGTVSGRLQGKILKLGADWQTIFADNSADLDTRYAFETDDGALIEIINKGIRHGSPEVITALAKGEYVDPSKYYMRTTARLETGDPRYDWVNRMIFVGTGSRLEMQVHLHLYVVE